MAEAVGPVFTGGFTKIASSDGTDRYNILFLPDKHNGELQSEGKPPVYYWMPAGVRIARRGGTGDYKFHLIHFVGVQSGDTTVGVTGTREVAGGVLSVTTTSAFPPGVLEDAQNQLMQIFQGKDDRYWGWRTPATPMFRPIPIVSNITTISNLAPDATGLMPAAQGPAPVPPGDGGAAPAGGPSGGPSGGPTGGPGRSRSMAAVRSIPVPQWRRMPRTVPMVRSFSGRDTDLSSNLNAWYFRMQGQGPGSIDPSGENAYTALMGSLPTAILWQGFHGEYSPLSVSQALKFQVWTQTLRITVDGEWDRIFSHFSANAKGRAWWFDADINVELNKLVMDGGIKVHIEIDGTLPNADKMREEASKRVDAIRESFMKQAEKRIFDPAPPEVKPAEASNGGGILGSIFGFGGGFALKYRRDETQLNLHYEETVDTKYLQDTVISSTLDGFFSEIKRDPDAERKYFTTLYLDDWDRKVTRIVKPVVNWPDPARKWVGEPVAFMSVQIGYPSVNGDVQWAGHVFQSTDTGDSTTWQPAVAKKNAADVVNAPAGWEPDITFVRRQIHFNEPPGESDYPYMKVFVEKNVVDLDEGEHGTPTDLNTIEVRADTVGKLEVGPVMLNVELENSKQYVEVEFKALGQREDGTERGITRFRWTNEDQAEPRFWEIYTGQMDYKPEFQYRVHVVVKGSLFSKGMEWYGPWEDGAGNGPLMISVPTQDDAGVTHRRSLTPREITSSEPIGNGAAQPGGKPAAQPVSEKPVSERPVSGKPKTTSSRPTGAPTGPPARTTASGPPRGRSAESKSRTVSGYSTEPAATSSKSARSKREQPEAPREDRVREMEAEEEELMMAGGWSDTDPSARV